MLRLGGARVLAIEVKRSLAPSLPRGFDLACGDVGATERYVVYPGSEAFALDRRATAIPLRAFVAKIEAADRS